MNLNNISILCRFLAVPGWGDNRVFIHCFHRGFTLLTQNEGKQEAQPDRKRGYFG